jgi:3-oxoacyl-[acyl-carrier-protein] synthase II
MSANNGRGGRRRVVVSGLGAVSPNGKGVDGFWESTRNGVSGIDTISQFDPEALPCRIAGEVKNFQPEEFLPQKELKRMGRAVPLAIAATRSVQCPVTRKRQPRRKTLWG